MDCEKVRQELVAFVDGQLQEKEAQVLKDHLAGCQACARELELTEKAVELSRMHDAPVLSRDFERNFWARFEREKKRSFFDITAYLPRWVLAASAAAATLLVAGWFVWTAGRPRVTEEDKVVASHLELFSDYEAINLMDLLDDFEVIEALDEEG